MEPYQQRVLDEKDALDDKLHDLTEFIMKSSTFECLEPIDQQLIKDQSAAMRAYSLILEKRIDRF